MYFVIHTNFVMEGVPLKHILVSGSFPYWFFGGIDQKRKKSAVIFILSEKNSTLAERNQAKLRKS